MPHKFKYGPTITSRQPKPKDPIPAGRLKDRVRKALRESRKEANLRQHTPGIDWPALRKRIRKARLRRRGYRKLKSTPLPLEAQ